MTKAELVDKLSVLPDEAEVLTADGLPIVDVHYEYSPANAGDFIFLSDIELTDNSTAQIKVPNVILNTASPQRWRIISQQMGFKLKVEILDDGGTWV